MSTGDRQPDTDAHDSSRVVRLRCASLERAGYEPNAARELAARFEIPLQDALNLLRAGFPPDVAFAMLTSGARPVF